MESGERCNGSEGFAAACPPDSDAEELAKYTREKLDEDVFQGIISSEQHWVRAAREEGQIAGFCILRMISHGESELTLFLLPRKDGQSAQ